MDFHRREAPKETAPVRGHGAGALLEGIYNELTQCRFGASASLTIRKPRNRSKRIVQNSVQYSKSVSHWNWRLQRTSNLLQFLQELTQRWGINLCHAMS
jgi:hypothetical protein